MVQFVCFRTGLFRQHLREDLTTTRTDRNRLPTVLFLYQHDPIHLAALRPDSHFGLLLYDMSLFEAKATSLVPPTHGCGRHRFPLHVALLVLAKPIQSDHDRGVHLPLWRLPILQLQHLYRPVSPGLSFTIRGPQVAILT